MAEADATVTVKVEQGEPLLSRWTSRKFWAMMFWQGVFTTMLWHGKLSITVFENLTWMLLGGYFVANIAQQWLVRRVP